MREFIENLLVIIAPTALFVVHMHTWQLYINILLVVLHSIFIMITGPFLDNDFFFVFVFFYNLISYQKHATTYP